MGWLALANGYGLAASAGVAGVVITGALKTESGDYMRTEAGEYLQFEC